MMRSRFLAYSREGGHRARDIGPAKGICIFGSGFESFDGSQHLETGSGGIPESLWKTCESDEWIKTTPKQTTSYVGLTGLGKAQEARSRRVITGRPPLFYHRPSSYLLLGLIISLPG